MATLDSVVAGLGAKPHKGPTPRLNDEQLARLEALLLEGADKHGWPNNLWTADRVAYLIDRHFGVAYHAEHVRKILKQRLDWTSQKPQLRAREQNDKEVERWKDDEFPRILRDAWRREAHLIFLDEAGFMLTPTVRRTLAPRGKTPIIKALQKHDRISAISCVTLGVNDECPGLYFELMPQALNVTADDIVAFLRQLRRELPGTTSTAAPCWSRPGWPASLTWCWKTCPLTPPA
jgi:transposase